MKRKIGKMYWLLALPPMLLFSIGLVDVIQVYDGKLERLGAWPAIAFLLGCALMSLWDIYGLQNSLIKYWFGLKLRLIVNLVISLLVLGQGLISLFSREENLALFGITLILAGLMAISGSILSNRAVLRAESRG